MKLVDWILEHSPGVRTESSDRIEVHHNSDEFSTIWLQSEPPFAEMCGEIRDFYQAYDGADLFSSTFKIAALTQRKPVVGGSLICTLDDIRRDFDAYNFSLPGPAFAFMYQAGIGFYCASPVSHVIYECDTETRDVTVYESLSSILQEWIEAVNDS